MNIQDWLAQLLSRPAADPLDWESYCVTMGMQRGRPSARHRGDASL
jgi:hypothetical protein